MTSHEAQVDVLERVLETLDVADARAGTEERVYEVRIPRVRIVELHCEGVVVSADLAHDPERAQDRHIARRVADEAHERPRDQWWMELRDVARSLGRAEDLT